jgi:hypothetical protein
MNPKLSGVLIVFGTIVFMIVLTFALGQIVSSNSSDGWAALGVVIMMMFLLGLVLTGELIAGLVLYFKKQNMIGLGMLYGLGGVVGLSILGAIVINVLNYVL